jgi:hypothetical protein
MQEAMPQISSIEKGIPNAFEQPRRRQKGKHLISHLQ